MILEQFQRIICFFEIDKEWWSKPIILQSSCWENCYIFWLNRQFAFAFWIAKPYCESLCDNVITDSEFKVVLARLGLSWKKYLSLHIVTKTVREKRNACFLSCEMTKNICWHLHWLSLELCLKKHDSPG